MKLFEICHNLFRLLCFVVVSCMIIVWINKFLIDEDLCLVDYKPFQSNDHLEPPDMSFCFYHPFIDENLKWLGINSTTYYHHLTGKRFDSTLTKIDHNNVTIDLKEYFYLTVVGYKNGSRQKRTDVSIDSNFNGFWYDFFMKCFTINLKEFDMTNVKFLNHYFKLNLLQYWRKNSDWNFLVKPHHRHQFTLQDNWKLLTYDKNATNGLTEVFLVTKVEILRRRNKAQDSCLEGSINWDESKFTKKVNEISCTAPYQEPYKNFSTCTTGSELERWFDWATDSKHLREPCQTMPMIDSELLNDMKTNEESFLITIGYPNEAKVITQSRAVDTDALIGNIGGYIGLFLGYAIVQLPELLFSVYKLLSNTSGKISGDGFGATRKQGNGHLTARKTNNGMGFNDRTLNYEMMERIGKIEK